ncbi:MAG: endo-1,4-beta-xylanase [Nocardiopsaceae bacterium]|nr:endo-1,4-beta-xylanase [Nocardiopsaceae bacterium]
MTMRRRSVLAAGAAGAAAVLTGGTSAAAATRTPATPDRRRLASAVAGSAWPGGSASLRSLADKVGLRIGSALYPEDISTASHSAIASGQFDVYTPANEMKWEVVEPEQGTFDWTGADNLVNYAKAHGAVVRGHCLCWHSQLPAWLTTDVANGKYTQAQLLDLLEQHIFTEMGRYRGKIWQWDVCNEFLTDTSPSGVDPNNWWIVNAGPEVITKAFQWAHEADPFALLFYNDYNNAGEDGTNAKFRACAALAESLQKNAHIDGIGIQGHLDTQYGWSPEQMREDIESYAAMGLKVAVTEADVRTFVNNSADQVPTDSLAQFAQPFEYQEMLKAALAVPECISFTVWGFTDENSWVPGSFKGEGYACLYDVNLRPKAAYSAFQSDLALAAFGAPQRVAGR